MYSDYHVHCSYSDDSKEPMENQIQRGIEAGLDEICFTDHVDYGIKRDHDDLISSLTRTNVDYPSYFHEIHQMQQKYKREIKVKAGLEFGIQTITIPQYENLFERYHDKLDFVLLSMHEVNNREFWNGTYMKGKSQKEYNDAYYEEIYKVQKAYRHYSILAHLDLLARYDPAGVYPFEKEEERIAEILKQAITDGKGIEINTSSWHYGLNDTQPSGKILKLYRDLGGRIITMGSDAHRKEYVADHFMDASEILRQIGFREYCTFEHMKPVFHEL